MADLFYCVPEKKAFWVCGYRDHYNVADQIKMLEECKRKFARMFPSGIRTDKMMTRMIEKSRRYKSMRVFWLETETVPAGAFMLGEWREESYSPHLYGFYHINSDETKQYYWDTTKWWTGEEDYKQRKELDPQPVVNTKQYLYWTMDKWLED